MQNKPPTAIIVVCAVLAIFTLLGLTSILAGSFLWIIYNLIDIVLGVAVIYGLWNMQKWSVILYTVLFIVSTIISLVSGGLSFMLIVPVAILVVMYMNYGLME